MKDTTDTEQELYFLRTHIEIRLIHLGVDSRLRRRIVKAIARISTVHKLTMLAEDLDRVREQSHGQSRADG